MERLGDKIAAVAQPIAKTIDWWFNTDIQHCTGCHQMQIDLNSGKSLADACYDRFFKKHKKEDK